MKNVSKIIMTIQIIMLNLWSFKHTKISLLKMSTQLGASFDSIFTLQCLKGNFQC
jgi:hypothetical protein